jgi:hypothetical protein
VSVDDLNLISLWVNADSAPSFEYLQPPPHRTIASLADTQAFGSRYLHISPPYTPEDLDTVLADLESIRNSSGKSWRPTIIYEPHPRSCEPSQCTALERVAPLIDTLS